MESQPVRRSRQAFNGLWRKKRRIEFLLPVRFDERRRREFPLAATSQQERSSHGFSGIDFAETPVPAARQLEIESVENRRRTSAAHALSS